MYGVCGSSQHWLRIVSTTFEPLTGAKCLMKVPTALPVPYTIFYLFQSVLDFEFKKTLWTERLLFRKGFYTIVTISHYCALLPEFIYGDFIVSFSHFLCNNRDFLVFCHFDRFLINRANITYNSCCVVYFWKIYFKGIIKEKNNDT